jgi:tetratricopeptide (TPR) repeat protein
MAKTKKKNRHGLKQIPKQIPVIREEDTAQAQEVLAHHHEIASELRKKFGRDQAQSALAEINNLPEAAQLALLKALAQEREGDAADIALALNELSSLENVRKEARRALIQMRLAGIYPQWRVPVYQTSPYQAVDDSKRSPVIDPYPDFDDDDDFDDDAPFNDEKEYAIDIHGLSATEVVEVFIRYWSRHKYRSTYSLLSEQGSLRANLSIDEWATPRMAWAEIAKPEESQIDYLQEIEPEASDFQLFDVAVPDDTTSTRVVEVAWSIVLEDTPESEAAPEFPQTLLAYPTTGRHWFWSKYLLEQQEDENWRISSVIDEGKNTLNMSTEELQQRLQESKAFFAEVIQYLSYYYNEGFARSSSHTSHVVPLISYYAALATKTPQDRTLLEEATTNMIRLKLYERAMAYLAVIAEHFPNDKVYTLNRLAIVQRQFSILQFDEMNDEDGDRFEELAKATLHESLEIEDNFEAHILLSELLTEDLKDHLDEAKDQLIQARAVSRGPADEATIEIHFGKIDMEEEQFEDALPHFQRAIELDPTSATAWFNVAEAYHELENAEEAEKCYRRAIELQPNNQNFYIRLSSLYNHTHRLDQAIEVLQEGLNANPDASDLQLHLMSAYLDTHNFEQVRIYLEEFAQKNPDAPLLQGIRAMLDMHERLLAIESAPDPTPVSVPARSTTPPRNRMEQPKPKRKKKKRR